METERPTFSPERVVEVSKVYGLNTYLLVQLSPDAGRAVAGRGKDGHAVVYVDAKEGVDLNNPLKHPTVRHELNELARQNRLGRELQRRYGSNPGESPIQRLQRATGSDGKNIWDRIPEVTHENAPKLPEPSKDVSHKPAVTAIDSLDSFEGAPSEREHRLGRLVDSMTVPGRRSNPPLDSLDSLDSFEGVPSEMPTRPKSAKPGNETNYRPGFLDRMDQWWDRVADRAAQHPGQTIRDIAAAAKRGILVLPLMLQLTVGEMRLSADSIPKAPIAAEAAARGAREIPASAAAPAAKIPKSEAPMPPKLEAPRPAETKPRPIPAPKEAVKTPALVTAPVSVTPAVNAPSTPLPASNNIGNNNTDPDKITAALAQGLLQKKYGEGAAAPVPASTSIPAALLTLPDVPKVNLGEPVRSVDLTPAQITQSELIEQFSTTIDNNLTRIMRLQWQNSPALESQIAEFNKENDQLAKRIQELTSAPTTPAPASAPAVPAPAPTAPAAAPAPIVPAPAPTSAVAPTPATPAVVPTPAVPAKAKSPKQQPSIPAKPVGPITTPLPALVITSAPTLPSQTPAQIRLGLETKIKQLKQQRRDITDEIGSIRMRYGYLSRMPRSVQARYQVLTGARQWAGDEIKWADKEIKRNTPGDKNYVSPLYIPPAAPMPIEKTFPVSQATIPAPAAPVPVLAPTAPLTLSDSPIKVPLDEPIRRVDLVVAPTPVTPAPVAPAAQPSAPAQTAPIGVTNPALIKPDPQQLNPYSDGIKAAIPHWIKQTAKRETGNQQFWGRTSVEKAADTLGKANSIGKYQLTVGWLKDYAEKKLHKTNPSLEELKKIADSDGAITEYLQQQADYWPRRFAEAGVGLFINSRQADVLIPVTGYPYTALSMERAMGLSVISTFAKNHAVAADTTDATRAYEAAAKVLVKDYNMTEAQAQAYLDEATQQHAVIEAGKNYRLSFINPRTEKPETTIITGTKTNNVAMELARYLGNGSQLPSAVVAEVELTTTERGKKTTAKFVDGLRHLSLSEAKKAFAYAKKFNHSRALTLGKDARGEADYKQRDFRLEFFSSAVGRLVTEDIGGEQNIVPSPERVSKAGDPHQILRPFNSGRVIAVSRNGAHAAPPLYSAAARDIAAHNPTGRPDAALGKRDLFGARRGNGERQHDGLDFREFKAKPRGNVYLYSEVPATIVWEGAFDTNYYGNALLYKDAAGKRFYLLAHNARNLVKAGARLPRGYPLAEMGKSGNAGTKMAHVEIIDLTENTAVNNLNDLLAAIRDGKAVRRDPAKELFGAAAQAVITPAAAPSAARAPLAADSRGPSQGGQQKQEAPKREMPNLPTQPMNLPAPQSRGQPLSNANPLPQGGLIRHMRSIFGNFVSNISPFTPAYAYARDSAEGQSQLVRNGPNGGGYVRGPTIPGAAQVAQPAAVGSDNSAKEAKANNTETATTGNSAGKVATSVNGKGDGKAITGNTGSENNGSSGSQGASGREEIPPQIPLQNDTARGPPVKVTSHKSSFGFAQDRQVTSLTVLNPNQNQNNNLTQPQTGPVAGTPDAAIVVSGGSASPFGRMTPAGPSEQLTGGAQCVNTPNLNSATSSRQARTKQSLPAPEKTAASTTSSSARNPSKPSRETSGSALTQRAQPLSGQAPRTPSTSSPLTGPTPSSLREDFLNAVGASRWRKFGEDAAAGEGAAGALMGVYVPSVYTARILASPVTLPIRIIRLIKLDFAIKSELSRLNKSGVRYSYWDARRVRQALRVIAKKASFGYNFLPAVGSLLRNPIIAKAIPLAQSVFPGTESKPAEALALLYAILRKGLSLGLLADGRLGRAFKEGIVLDLTALIGGSGQEISENIRARGLISALHAAGYGTLVEELFHIVLGVDETVEGEVMARLLTARIIQNAGIPDKEAMSPEQLADFLRVLSEWAGFTVTDPAQLAEVANGVLRANITAQVLQEPEYRVANSQPSPGQPSAFVRDSAAGALRDIKTFEGLFAFIRRVMVDDPSGAEKLIAKIEVNVKGITEVAKTTRDRTAFRQDLPHMLTQITRGKGTPLEGLRHKVRGLLGEVIDQLPAMAVPGPEEIIAANLARIRSEEFQDVVGRESMGGNAGDGCVGVNGVMDGAGRIQAFGNSQELAPELRDALERGRLVEFGIAYKRLVTEKNKASPRYELVYTGSGLGGISAPAAAVAVLKASVEQANLAAGMPSAFRISGAALFNADTEAGRIGGNRLGGQKLLRCNGEYAVVLQVGKTFVLVVRNGGSHYAVRISADGKQLGSPVNFATSIDIGREDSTNRFMLGPRPSSVWADEQVSRRHARIEAANGTITVTDLNSLYGTSYKEIMAAVDNKTTAAEAIKINNNRLELKHKSYYLIGEIVSIINVNYTGRSGGKLKQVVFVRPETAQNLKYGVYLLGSEIAIVILEPDVVTAGRKLGKASHEGRHGLDWVEFGRSMDDSDREYTARLATLAENPDDVEVWASFQRRLQEYEETNNFPLLAGEGHAQGTHKIISGFRGIWGERLSGISAQEIRNTANLLLQRFYQDKFGYVPNYPVIGRLPMVPANNAGMPSAFRATGTPVSLSAADQNRIGSYLDSLKDKPKFREALEEEAKFLGRRLGREVTLAETVRMAEINSNVPVGTKTESLRVKGTAAKVLLARFGVEYSHDQGQIQLFEDILECMKMIDNGSQSTGLRGETGTGKTDVAAWYARELLRDTKWQNKLEQKRKVVVVAGSLPEALDVHKSAAITADGFKKQDAIQRKVELVNLGKGIMSSLDDLRRADIIVIQDLDAKHINGLAKYLNSNYWELGCAIWDGAITLYTEESRQPELLLAYTDRVKISLRKAAHIMGAFRRLVRYGGEEAVEREITGPGGEIIKAPRLESTAFEALCKEYGIGPGEPSQREEALREKMGESRFAALVTVKDAFASISGVDDDVPLDGGGVGPLDSEGNKHDVHFHSGLQAGAMAARGAARGEAIGRTDLGKIKPRNARTSPMSSRVSDLNLVEGIKRFGGIGEIRMSASIDTAQARVITVLFGTQWASAVFIPKPRNLSLAGRFAKSFAAKFSPENIIEIAKGDVRQTVRSAHQEAVTSSGPVALIFVGKTGKYSWEVVREETRKEAEAAGRALIVRETTGSYFVMFPGEKTGDAHPLDANKDKPLGMVRDNMITDKKGASYPVTFLACRPFAKGLNLLGREDMVFRILADPCSEYRALPQGLARVRGIFRLHIGPSGDVIVGPEFAMPLPNIKITVLGWKNDAQSYIVKTQENMVRADRESNVQIATELELAQPHRFNGEVMRQETNEAARGLIERADNAQRQENDVWIHRNLLGWLYLTVVRLNELMVRNRSFIQRLYTLERDEAAGRDIVRVNFAGESAVLESPEAINLVARELRDIQSGDKSLEIQLGRQSTTAVPFSSALTSRETAETISHNFEAVDLPISAPKFRDGGVREGRLGAAEAGKMWADAKREREAPGAQRVSADMMAMTVDEFVDRVMPSSDCSEPAREEYRNWLQDSRNNAAVVGPDGNWYLLGDDAVAYLHVALETVSPESR
ncbi:MAG: FHA domain-containing protein, partial [Candidatus Omnitrophota bacterium]|nr:FHA domain-containing protein [Candidatus Omnitrophota bacterium]